MSQTVTWFFNNYEKGKRIRIIQQVNTKRWRGRKERVYVSTSLLRRRHIQLEDSIVFALTILLCLLLLGQRGR